MVMKTKYLIFFVLFAFALPFALPLVAQVTNTAPVLGTDPLPETKETLWTLVIAIITPVIIWLATKLPGNIPKPLLPVLTPFVGFVIGLILNWLASANLSWVDMAQAGALGSFVREVVNQNITKRILGEAASKSQVETKTT